MSEIFDDESFFTNDEPTSECTEKANICKYPFRCKECYSIAKIEDFDFKSSKYNISCKNGHYFNYDSYENLIDKAIINLNNALCNICMKSQSNKDLFKCNICNKFFCNDCKDTHKEKSSHSNFIKLNEIIIFNDKNDKKNITNYNDDESRKIQDFNKKIINVKQALHDLKNEITKKIDYYLEVINNYYETHENFYICYKNNIEDFGKNDILNSNLKLFQDNILRINNYLEDTINNIKKSDFEEKILSFIKILKDFDSTDVFTLKEKRNKKIVEMDKMKLNLDSETNCFCPFNQEKYMLFGLKTGEIKMYQQTNKSHFKYVLSMEAFGDQVQHICELDKDLIAATDGKSTIKIIQFKENYSNYTIVQTLSLKEDSGYIYSMIPLPLLSSNNKNHYFCTGDDKHILIFKSNSEPKYLNGKEEDNKDIFFELFKDIKVNTLVHCLIEANENYIFAACTEKNIIKIFDMKNNFKELEDIKGFELSKGSNILALVPVKNILIVGCTDGFILINIRKRKIYKRVHCRYSVLCLDMLSENTLVCCTSDKNENRIKQYSLEEGTFQFNKISERKIHNNYNIWKLKKVNQKIFFLDNENKVNYLI